MVRFVTVTVGLIALVGCASIRTGGSDDFSPDRALFAPEIVASRVTDAYQAVLRLRPAFLRRGARVTARADATTQIHVYLDDVDMGGIDALRRVPLDAVTQIRYVSPTEADIRWPGRHPAGVILVSTEPNPR